MAAAADAATETVREFLIRKSSNPLYVSSFCGSPHFTIDMLEEMKRRGFSLDYFNTYLNPNINIEYVIENRIYRNYINVCSKERFIEAIEWFRTHEPDYQFTFTICNPEAPLEYYEENERRTGHRKDWLIYCKNHNLTEEYLRRHIDCFEHAIREGKIYPGQILSHKCVSMNFIEEYRLFGYGMLFHISSNPNITIDFVKKHIETFRRHGTSVWEHLSMNPGIKMKDIQETMDDPAFNWKFIWVSKNPNLTIEFIRRNIDQKWSWYEITRNPNITIEMIEANKDLPFWKIDKNPNLTMEYVINHPEIEWNWENILANPMNQPCRKKMATRIQKWWRFTTLQWRKRVCLQKAIVLENWFYHPDNPVMTKMRRRKFLSSMESVVICSDD